MPFITDEDYQQFLAMRGAGAAQQGDRRFDAAAPAAATVTPGAQAMQAAYQGYAQQPGGLQMGPDTAPGIGEFQQRLSSMASAQGLAGQWRPTAGAGGGYWSGVGTDDATQAKWAEAVKQANLQQSTAGAYDQAGQSMQDMQSRRQAEAGAQRSANSATPAQPAAAYGQPAASRPPQQDTQQAAQQASQQADREARQRAMETATTRGWGAF